MSFAHDIKFKDILTEQQQGKTKTKGHHKHNKQVLLSKQISFSLIKEMFLYQPKFSSSCPLGVISNFSSSHRQACEGLSLFKS